MRRVSDAFQRLEGLLLKPEVKQVTAMRSFGRGSGKVRREWCWVVWVVWV